MKLNDKTRNLSLDIIRIIAVFAVMMIHVSGWFVAVYHQGTPEFVVGNILDGIARLGVPLFVMVSGALMLNEEKELSMKKIIKKYIGSIVYLFVVWSFFYVVKDHIAGPLLHGKTIVLKEVIRSFIEGYYHMWYLYMIVGLYLITPFLRCFVKRANKDLVLWFIGISLLFQFCVPVIKGIALIWEPFGYLNKILDMFYLEFFNGFTTYYLAGWYIAHVGLDKKWQKYMGISAGAALLLIISYVHFTKDYANAYTEMNLFVFIYSAGVFSVLYNLKMPENHKVKENIILLSNLCFGVYMVHPIYQSAFETYVVYNGRPVVYMLSNFVLVSIAAFVTSYGMSKIPILKKLIRM